MYFWIVFLSQITCNEWYYGILILTNTFKHLTEPQFINIVFQTQYLSFCYIAILQILYFAWDKIQKSQALFDHNAEGGKILVVSSVIIHCPRQSMGNRAHLLLVLQHIARFLGSKKGKNGRQNIGEHRAGVRRKELTLWSTLSTIWQPLSAWRVFIVQRD